MKTDSSPCGCRIGEKVKQLNFHISRHIAHLGWETPSFFFCLVYIGYCRIKLFLRHLPNCPCSNFSRYVDLFQEISPRIAKQLRFQVKLHLRRKWHHSIISISQFEFLPEKLFVCVCVNSYLPWTYFSFSIFRWSLCHFYEIICLLFNMFFQWFISCAKKFRDKYSERIWVFHCRYSIR